MMLAVFFPSLMGVGIIISGALLISDWLRRLLPRGGRRRHHNVVVGIYGTVGDAVRAAGYRLAEPWFLKRGLRHRAAYLGLFALFELMAVGAMWAGSRLYTDPPGVFYRNPWAIGLGYGAGSVLLIAGGTCLVTAVAYRSLPRFLRRLVATTSLGAIVLPTEADHQSALNNLTKEA